MSQITLLTQYDDSSLCGTMWTTTLRFSLSWQAYQDRLTPISFNNDDDDADGDEDVDGDEDEAFICIPFI